MANRSSKQASNRNRLSYHAQVKATAKGNDRKTWDRQGRIMKRTHEAEEV
jgi:hypothetical protein